MEDDGFVLVKAKRSKSKQYHCERSCADISPLKRVELSDFEIQLLHSRVQAFEKILTTSPWFSLMAEYIYKVLSDRKFDTVELRALGMGSVSESIISRHQLAVFLQLKKYIAQFSDNIDVTAFDPIFSISDKTILQDFNISLLEDETSLVTHEDILLIVFAIHCDKELYEMFLSKNLSKLSNVVVVGNSFTAIVDQVLPDLNEEAATFFKSIIYAQKIGSEQTLPTSLCEWPNSFNNTSIHWFPS